MYTRFIYVYSSLYSKAALLNYELEVDITGCPLVTVAQSDTLEHFAQRYTVYLENERVKRVDQSTTLMCLLLLSFIIPFLLLYIFISSCLPAFALVDDYSA